jgi:iron complex outermembrane recepter protein
MRRRHSRTLIAVALALAPWTSLGQEAARDTLPVVPLDTISARVLRSPLPALRAPYAVSAAGGEAQRRAKPGLALDELLAAVPGVQVDNRYNWALGERISVRGFGARAQFGVRGVRVLVDGLPATLPDGQTTLNHVDAGAVERAEVVRGPASALYGNAAGGVIRLSTLPPPPVPLWSEYRVTGGSGGLLRLQSQAAGELGGVSYRVGLTRLRYDGFRDHAEADNTLASGSVAWRGRRGALRLSFSAVTYDALNPGSLTDSLLRADRTAAAPVNLTYDTGEEGRQGQLGLSWERALGSGGVEVSGWVLARAIDNPIPFNWIKLDRELGGARAALSGALGAVRWTAGAEAEQQRDHRLNFANQQGTPGALTRDQAERVTALAGFAQATATLGSRLDVMAAARYDRFRFAADDRLVGEGDPDDSGARTMDAFSPTAGVSFAAAPGVSLYANLSTAFETPTTTELVNRPTGAGGFNPELEPQRTTSYEAGVKARSRTAWLEVAAYRARVRDALVPFEVEGAPGRQFFRNAGSARHRGVEAAAGAVPFRGATARVAYTWTDARFGRYVVGGVDLEGNRVPGIAPHRVEGTFHLSSDRGPFAGVDARWVDEIPVDDDAPELRSSAYALVDVRAGWEALRLGRLRATPTVSVANLFDVEYNASVVVNAARGRYYEPGPGRSLYLGVEVGFGAGER